MEINKKVPNSICMLWNISNILTTKLFTNTNTISISKKQAANDL